jgi:hypothetical protein
MSSGETSPRSHLKIGLTGQIGTVSLNLKGYIRCSASDDEDTWYWEEWYAGTDSGDELWLEFDEESDQYTLFRKLTTVTVTNSEQQTKQTSIQLSSGERFDIAETAQAKIITVHGDLPEGHTVGSQFVYHEGTHYRGAIFTVEESDEFEVFKGEVVDPQTLFKAFNMVSALARYEWQASQKKLWDFARTVCLIVAGTGIVALVMLAGTGTKVLDRVITTCAAQTTNCPAEEQLLGPVVLSKANRAYKLDIATNKGINQQNWQAVTVTLLDESMKPLSAVEGDFWEEAWSEGGESGVERNTKKEKYFRLTKSGTYYLKTTVEPASAVSQPITLSIRLYEDVMYWPYFISLIVGGLGIVGVKDKWYTYLGE